MSKLTLNRLQKMKSNREKIAMITVYDGGFARLLSEESVDIAFIGDSVGMTFQGNHTTIPVTLEQMIYHTRCVANNNEHCYVLADLPFMSYHTPQVAMESAKQLMQAGAEMVKIEGGMWLCETIHLLTERGIAVCGHIGLIPQSIHVLGSYKVQGRNEKEAQQLVKEAKAIEQAGAKMLVVECVPHTLAQSIAEQVSIPVIGIGAGPGVDGQVLVLYDMLGMTQDKSMKFVQNFLEGQSSIRAAIRAYVEAVKSGVFPTLEQSFT